MKYILLFVYSLSFSIYSLFFGDPVTIKGNFPEKAKPGSEFTAEVTINKGQTAGFAKFQMELPQGFSAKEGDSKGGSFSLNGQTAKIIWTSVPSDGEFTIKMTIMVDASASGDKVIQGKYSYIESNAKQQVELSPVTVNIPSENAAVTTTPVTTETTPAATVATTSPDTSNKQPFQKPEEPTTAVNVTRTITPGKTTGTYLVELKVKKDGLKGFAKLQERVPDGFIAIGDKTDGANFSFNSSEHLGKFVWTSLPAKDELMVSYKVMPKQGAAQATSALVEGEFSYLESDQTKKFVIEKQDLAGGTQTAVAPPDVTTTPTVAVTPTVVPEATVATTEPVATTTTAASTPTVATTEPVVTETTTPVTTTTEVQKNTNVHYAVQVGAFKNGVNVAALSSRFGLSGVTTEMQDGYTKCITGQHTEYRSARDARENIKSKGVSDAFVTAYNSGRRITVQEALMITSQKWFR